METRRETQALHTYHTPSGVVVARREFEVDRGEALAEIVANLDNQRGALLSSGYEFPGRYTRWDIGFSNPPICLTTAGRDFRVDALNERGEVLLGALDGFLRGKEGIARVERLSPTHLSGQVSAAAERFAEEQRSRQPSAFSVIRAITRALHSSTDAHLGLYGAFGYDLCFQFEPTDLCRPRPVGQRDVVVYLPDSLVVVDRQLHRARRIDYEFSFRDQSTVALPRRGPLNPFTVRDGGPTRSDHSPGEYATKVERARESFRQGELFELVLSQVFETPCSNPPSTIFRRLQKQNPAPFAFLINLGQAEYLIGASPEMYVRVEGRRVETCPISGTIARGTSPLEDETRIRELLNSSKDESELTMCTDVDRNDKSRICEPGSVRVLGRRQIEMYSRLIHTVDHVQGVLRPEFDALDAFLSHAWAVTVTGAPKPAAIRRVERDENTPRAWYGGAVGAIGFDGNLNTGLTLRTIRVISGTAEVRAGATLLYDSDPEAEELETRLKASALLDAVLGGDALGSASTPEQARFGAGLRALLVDHEDSFVHTLANYFRQLGVEVVTERAPFDDGVCARVKPDFVVLSPGPGRPTDFALSDSIRCALHHGLPLFGVCLGLQGIVEYFGGTLEVLDYPMHGKASEVRIAPSDLFAGLPERFVVGRYHSLVAAATTLPASLHAIAHGPAGEIMAIEHERLPVMAVQFHPESLLSASGDCGLKVLRNVVKRARNEAIRRRSSCTRTREGSMIL